METQESAEASLSSYLKQFTSNAGSVLSLWNEQCPRVRCERCHASRYLYCSDCLSILIDAVHWPTAISSGSLRLPFALDVFLADRRSSSTGVQLITLLRASESVNLGKSDPANSENKSGELKLPLQQVRLFDVEFGDSLPSYENESDQTFLLFPCDTSVSLSETVQAGPIRRLVVLDCKWRKSSIRDHPCLKVLRKVHLDNPPNESFYWRWHNKGAGMLSTIEAVYYAAWQILEAKKQEGKQILVELFWLFALQRDIIQKRYETGDLVNFERPIPFSKEGKESNRVLRRQRQTDDCL